MGSQYGVGPIGFGMRVTNQVSRIPPRKVWVLVVRFPPGLPPPNLPMFSRWPAMGSPRHGRAVRTADGKDTFSSQTQTPPQRRGENQYFQINLVGPTVEET